MPPKRCEVCGSPVRLIGEGPFGSCEKCGLVYMMDLTLAQEETASGSEQPSPVGPSKEQAEDEEPGAAGARWRCPDCDELLMAENEGDLKFVIREHVKEFHPNRE